MRAIRHYPVSLLLAVPALAVVTTCEESETTVIYALCDPTLEQVAPTDDAGEENVVSTQGGTLTVQGHYLWVPSPITAAETSPTPTTVESAYSDLPAIQVLVGGQPARVIAAHDTVVPGVTEADLTADGELQTSSSDCLTCASCMADNDNGCGGCTVACEACVQEVTFEVPLLLPGIAGTITDDEHLASWIEVITSTGHSNRLPYSFPPACSDGVDNDADGAIDDADDACSASPWSESLACEDGIDNDGDGWIDGDDAGCATDPDHEEDACADGVDNDGDGLTDLEDPACAGDPRGQSESSTTAPPACSNGIDDDGDTHVDADDSRCTSGTDTDESQP